MNKFEYFTTIRVVMDGKYVGDIKHDSDGWWQFIPKGSRTGGKKFHDFLGVKASIEAE